MVTDKGKHQFRFYKVYGKENLTALFPFYRIKLSHRQVRMFLKVSIKIFICPSNAAGLVYFEMTLYLACTVANLAGQINVHGRNDAGINQPVNGSFAYHNGIRIGYTDVMRRLLFPDKWRNEFVKIPDFVFGIRDTGSGF